MFTQSLWLIIEPLFTYLVLLIKSIIRGDKLEEKTEFSTVFIINDWIIRGAYKCEILEMLIESTCFVTVTDYQYILWSLSNCETKQYLC